MLTIDQCHGAESNPLTDSSVTTVLKAVETRRRSAAPLGVDSRPWSEILTLFRGQKVNSPVSLQFGDEAVPTTKAAECIPAAQRPSFGVELRGLEPLTPTLPERTCPPHLRSSGACTAVRCAGAVQYDTVERRSMQLRAVGFSSFAPAFAVQVLARLRPDDLQGASRGTATETGRGRSGLVKSTAPLLDDQAGPSWAPTQDMRNASTWLLGTSMSTPGEF